MADIKPLPPSASAEGETAALQAQVIDAGTLDKEDVSQDTVKPVVAASKSKKGADAGFKNYIVSSVASVGIQRADVVTARVQVWNGA
jgi:hydrogenase maturation factor HypE